MYVKGQIDSNHSIGQVAKIGPSVLRRRMKEAPIHVGGVPQEFSEKATLLIQSARQLDRTNTENLIQGLVKRLGLEQAIQLIFFPVLKSIGELWHRGQISISGEHLVTQAIRRHLVESIKYGAKQGGPIVILACAPNDFHEIGAMTATLLLQRQGWQPIYLGTDSGIDMIRLACKRRLAKRIIISMVKDSTHKHFSRMINDIQNKLLPLCPVSIGGHGASAFRDLMEQSGITYFEDFNQVKYLNPRVVEEPHLTTHQGTTKRRQSYGS